MHFVSFPIVYFKHLKNVELPPLRKLHVESTFLQKKGINPAGQFSWKHMRQIVQIGKFYMSCSFLLLHIYGKISLDTSNKL